MLNNFWWEIELEIIYQSYGDCSVKKNDTDCLIVSTCLFLLWNLQAERFCNNHWKARFEINHENTKIELLKSTLSMENDTYVPWKQPARWQGIIDAFRKCKMGFDYYQQG